MTLKVSNTQAQVLLMALDLLQDGGNTTSDVLRIGRELSDEINHLVDLQNLADKNVGRLTAKVRK